MVVKKLLIGGIEYTFRYEAQTGRMHVVGGTQDERVFIITDVRHDPITQQLFLNVDGQPECVFIDGSVQEVSVVTPATKAPTANTVVKSPLSGRVVRIVVQQGQAVRTGQPLVFIESMKMENEICALNDAIVKTIFIAEGNVVQPNQLLIEFEKEKEGDGDAVRQVKYEQEAV